VDRLGDVQSPALRDAGPEGKLRTNFSHRTWGLSPRLSVFRRDVEDHVAVVLDMTMPVLITADYARESAQKKVTDNELIDFLQKPFLPKPEFPP
jgi:hypothetical protein